jgi:hypothetical protein
MSYFKGGKVAENEFYAIFFLFYTVSSRAIQFSQNTFVGRKPYKPDLYGMPYSPVNPDSDNQQPR